MDKEPKNATADLLNTPLRVINVGLEGFARELAEQGVEVVQLDWSPPAGGDPVLANLLSKLGT
jgi:FdrA protein